MSINKIKPEAYLQASSRLCEDLIEKTVVSVRKKTKKKRGYFIGRSFSQESPLIMIQRAEKTSNKIKYKELDRVSGSTELEDDRAKGRKKINIPRNETICHDST